MKRFTGLPAVDMAGHSATHRNGLSNKFKIIEGKREEGERELVAALFTPWEKQHLGNCLERLKRTGELVIVHSSHISRSKRG